MTDRIRRAHAAVFVAAAALFVPLVMSCKGSSTESIPSSETTVSAPATQEQAPERRPGLRDRTPTRLVQGETVDVVDTDLRATLLRSEYAHGIRPDGREGAIAWANIRFEAPDGRIEEVRWDLYETAEVLGHRFYLDGSRSLTKLYTLD